MIVPDDLLEEIRELLENMQDINGSGGPNKAMQLLTRLNHECRPEANMEMKCIHCGWTARRAYCPSCRVQAIVTKPIT